MRSVKKIAIFSFTWLALALLAWLVFLHRQPQSIWEWLFVLILGPPVYVILSIIGNGVGAVFHSLPGIRHAEAAVERETASERFSVVRIVVYLGEAFVLLAFVGAIYWLVKTLLG